MKDIECVFYRMCAKGVFLQKIEKANILSGIELRPELSVWVRIRDNNNLFLEELNERIPNGFKDCDWWLRGLLADYVKRRAINDNTGYETQYYIDWLNNTRFICNLHGVIKWCDEYQSFLENDNYLPTQEERELMNTLSNCLDRKTIDELLKDLSNPQLTKQGVAHIYKNYNVKGVLKDSGISFRRFCDSAVKFLHKEGLEGWNYNYIKRFL